MASDPATRFDFTAWGSAFVDARLHKLRETITRQSDLLFQEQGVEIPSSCTSVVLFLAPERRASIAQIADALGYSHQLINQRLAQLEAQAFVERRSDQRDRRRRLIALTAAGRRQAQLLEALLPRVAMAFQRLFDEIGVDLEQGLSSCMDALHARPLTRRVAEIDEPPRTDPAQTASRPRPGMEVS